jgi:hypothetical protein
MSVPIEMPLHNYQATQFYQQLPAYDAAQYAMLQTDPPTYEQTQSAHIHAPIPISAYSTLLPHVDHASSNFSPPSLTTPPCARAEQLAELPRNPSPYVIMISPAPEHPQPYLVSEMDEDEKLQDTLEQYDVPQVMFPTPGELLANIAKKELEGRMVPHRDSRATVAPLSTTPASPLAEALETQATQNSRRKPKPKAKAKVPAVLQPIEPGRTENLRKSYFRTVADQVGFQPTDP